MSNGAKAAPEVTSYRVVRELGSRAVRSYAAIRARHEVVVVQRFGRAVPKAPPRDDGATMLDAEGLAQLVGDARCLAKNWHPNIARVKHVDVDGDDVTIASDLVDGATLRDLLAASGDSPLLPYPVVVRILVDVLAGLNALHGLRDADRGPLGVIHGELCPANIVVGRDGVARLVNNLRPRPILEQAGSEGLAYAAPEALDTGGTTHVRADVYSVGAVLWEAIVGIAIYEENDPTRLLARQRAEEIVTPAIDSSSPFAGLGAIAMKAIAFEPALRYRTAAEMATALRKLAGPLIASGSVVAATVAELAGERIRARRAELDPPTVVRKPAVPGSSPRLAAPVAAPVEEAAPAPPLPCIEVAAPMVIDAPTIPPPSSSPALLIASAVTLPRPPPVPRKAPPPVVASPPPVVTAAPVVVALAAIPEAAPEAAPVPQPVLAPEPLVATRAATPPPVPRDEHEIAGSPPRSKRTRAVVLLLLAASLLIVFTVGIRALIPPDPRIEAGVTLTPSVPSTTPLAPLAPLASVGTGVTPVAAGDLDPSASPSAAAAASPEKTNSAGDTALMDGSAAPAVVVPPRAKKTYDPLGI